MSSKVILLIACILSIIIHFNNASLLRNSRNSVDGPAVEKGESGGASAEEDESGASGASGKGKKPSKFTNARAHIHTDCTGKDCKSSALYNNITSWKMS